MQCKKQLVGSPGPISAPAVWFDVLTPAHTLHHSEEMATAQKSDSSVLNILTDAKTLTS